MMKYILMLILTFFHTRCLTYHQPSVKSVAIYSEVQEKKHDIQMIEEKEIYKCSENTEFLNLAAMNLRRVNNDIIRSDAMRHISLTKNFFKRIPQNILDHVPYLLCFNLSHNSINLYKENEIDHLHLQMLDLSYQTIPDINGISEVEAFDETEDIYKYSHMIFNSINIKLPSLKYLDLCGNDISTLPWEFNVAFPQLVRLDLMNINAIQLEPKFFDKIPKSLRVLHLENNYFRNLTLQNVAEITSLYLDGNPFQKINITSTKLRKLSLSNCSNLRTGLFDIPHLEELNLSRNKLDNIFDSFFTRFQSLQKLVLDYNNLSSIPTLTNLQWLNELSLRYNMIKYIQPNTFEYLTALTKLSLKGNRIERIEKETFSGLEGLIYLDLSENQLSHLSIDWATPLKKLQYLNLNSNQFGSIAEMGVYSMNSSLQYLFAKNNSFTKITTMEMEPLPEYITVYLA